MSDTDDGYEAAIDHDPGADADTGPAEGVAVEAREVVRDRGVKETTRKLFESAASKLKSQLDAQGDGFDDLEPAIGHESSEAAAGASASVPDASKAIASKPAVAAPTDPAAQAIDSHAAAQLELREKSLKDREVELNKRADSLLAREQARERYHEKPGETLISLVKEWTGLDGDELKDELTDIVTELSSIGLGLPVPEQHKQRVEARRAVRTVKAYKAEIARKEGEIAKKQEQVNEKVQRQSRIETVRQALLSDEGKKLYPYLSVEDGAAEILVEMYDEKKKQLNGAEPNGEELAGLAENHFKKKYDDWYAKRRHLFATAAPKEAPVAAGAPQGDPQSRRSSTLTNKTAAPVPPASSSDEEGFDRDAHRRRSLSTLKERLKEASAE